MSRIWSSTQLGLFARCPRLWFLRYGMGLRTEHIAPSYALLYGQALHAGAAILHTGGTIAEAHASFAALYGPHRDIDAQRPYELGEDALTYYAENLLPSLRGLVQNGQTEVQLSTTSPLLMGVGDWVGVERTTGRPLLIEVKSRTVTFIKAHAATLALNGQMRLYAAMLTQASADVLVQVVYFGTHKYRRGGTVSVSKASELITSAQQQETLTAAAHVADFVTFHEDDIAQGEGRAFPKLGQFSEACASFNRVCDYAPLCAIPDTETERLTSAMEGAYEQRRKDKEDEKDE